MRKHEKGVHMEAKEKKFECRFNCGKKFLSELGMYQHIKSVHLDAKVVGDVKDQAAEEMLLQHKEQMMLVE